MDRWIQTYTAHVSVISPFLVVHIFSSQGFRGIQYISLFWRWGDISSKSTVHWWMKESFSNVIRAFPWDLIRKSHFHFLLSGRKPATERRNPTVKENMAIGKFRKKLCMCHVKHSGSQSIFSYSFKNPILNAYYRLSNLLFSHLVSGGEEKETAYSTAGSTCPLVKEPSCRGVFAISQWCARVHEDGTLQGNPIMLIQNNVNKLFLLSSILFLVKLSIM